MKIQDKRIVAIDYILRDDSGKVIDESGEHGPLEYLHGAGNLVVGLERELTGKQEGDEIQAIVSCEEGYGARIEDAVKVVPKEVFKGIKDLEAGMILEADTEGGPMPVYVVRIDEDTVTLDGNHPLAGMNLHFAVTVRNVREATQQELEHGHVHGGGCCG